MDNQRQGCFRVGLKWLLRGCAVILLLLIVAFLVIFRTALYDRFYLFPKQAQAWAQFQADRVVPGLDDGWNEYRGCLHAHSELSHDSAIPFPDIVQALKIDDVDFICMTDHYDDGKADYSLGWNGMHDGILFVRGYELDHGLMPWGIPEDTVFLASDEPRALAKRIHELGAVLFYSHTEQERMWDLPELEGMEIYNIHTDFLDEDKASIRKLIPQLLLNLHAYPQQTLRLIFDAPAGQLARWDILNQTRHITGIAANDSHQNVGVRGFYTEKDTVILKGTGEKTEIIKEIHLNFLTCLLFRIFCGPLEPNRQILRIELDPYARSCHFVNTHVLAKSCTEKDILDSLRAGRAFVAFTMLADAKGFVCFAQGQTNKAVMGESIPLEPGLKLRAAAPNRCRFTVLKDGQPAEQFEGTELNVEITQPGKYRVEADLNIVGEWTPWIYGNPIDITPSST
ncbi:MAG TPA: hypothetical protein PLI09_25550 [Candidatus Hydrogenedentes bacterium]|nr:hypothetical protein [Candidatus Hydrogenedentota bacterium]